VRERAREEERKRKRERRDVTALLYMELSITKVVALSL
jgi:hypothetical protein